MLSLMNIPRTPYLPRKAENQAYREDGAIPRRTKVTWCKIRKKRKRKDKAVIPSALNTPQPLS